MCVHTCLQTSLHIFIKGVGGQCNYRHSLSVRTVEFPYLCRCLQSVHFRHSYVHEDSVVVPDPACGKLIEYEPAVYFVIHDHSALFEYHFHYLGIYLNIFRKKYMSAVKICFVLLPQFGYVLLFACRAELIKHIVCKERLCDKAVNACFCRFVDHIVPLISRNDNYSGLVTDYITQLLCGLNAVHSGHFQIDKYQVVKLLPCVMNANSFYCLRTRKNGLAGHTRLFEHKLSVFAGYGIVVNNEDFHIIRLYLRTICFVCLVRRVHKRHGDSKGRTLSLFALDLDITVHHINDILCYRHTKSGAAVFVGSGVVLLTERIEDMREVFLAHAYARVGYLKAECGLSAEFGSPFHRQLDAAALGSELDCVSENIYENLTQLHIVADVVIVYLTVYAAVVGLLVFSALSAENGVYLFKKLREREILVFKHHSAALYPRHIENIVNET